MDEPPTRPLDCETLAREIADLQACESFDALQEILTDFVAWLGRS